MVGEKGKFTRENASKRKFIENHSEIISNYKSLSAI